MLLGNGACVLRVEGVGTACGVRVPEKEWPPFENLKAGSNGVGLNEWGVPRESV